jgi:protein-tyrosine kinase
MREVDQALAHAYARRGGSAREAVPPPPHVSPRTPAGPSATTTVLQWPALVQALDRTVGDRFDRLAEALVQARDRRHVKVVLVTSAHRTEGRTTLVLTLARALARRPGRTLLVDVDLTGPMLARQLGLRPRVGLDDVVEHNQALSDALVEAPNDRLTVLPLRAPVGHPRGFVTGPAWSCTMARLRREFDLVLLDGGPLFAGLGTAVVPGSIDAALLVRSRTLSGDRTLERARLALEAGGVPLLGVAETFVA